MKDHRHKLTDEQIKDIIDLYEKYTQVELAAMFNVTQPTISSVIRKHRERASV